ncbi:type III pantothenate kinase, partial [bacterium]|nr:type III pantothenate kinase [bacterium]
MLLTVDIGNTNITLGVFDGENYIKEFRLASDRDLSVTEYETLIAGLLKEFAIDGCIVASVVDELDDKVKHALDRVLGLNSIFIS